MHPDLLFDPASGMDQCTQGLNFDTLRPRIEIFSDYKRVLEAVYDPVGYAKRLDRLSVSSAAPTQIGRCARTKREASLADWRLFIESCRGCREHKTSSSGRSLIAQRGIRNGLELLSC